VRGIVVHFGARSDRHLITARLRFTDAPLRDGRVQVGVLHVGGTVAPFLNGVCFT
jgi:hypothetical protein